MKKMVKFKSNRFNLVLISFFIILILSIISTSFSVSAQDYSNSSYKNEFFYNFFNGIKNIFENYYKNSVIGKLFKITGYSVSSYPECCRGLSCGSSCGGGFCDATTPCGGCSCIGLMCGTDGCGHSCGTCYTGQTCINGQCVSSCTPKTCSQLGKTCGAWDNGCQQLINCGYCSSGQTCSNGQCVSSCTNPCASGSTKCSGTTGYQTCVYSGSCNLWGSVTSCGTGQTCDPVDGKCKCIPNCNGKECGPDGCGGSCGSCPTGCISGLGLCCVPQTCNDFYSKGMCGKISDNCGKIITCNKPPVDENGNNQKCVNGITCEPDPKLFPIIRCEKDKCTPQTEFKDCGQCNSCIVNKNNLPRVDIFFISQTTCSPCKAWWPEVNRIVSQYSDVTTIEKIEIDTNDGRKRIASLQKKYPELNINGIGTPLIYFGDTKGKILGSLQGRSEDNTATLQNYLAELKNKGETLQGECNQVKDGNQCTLQEGEKGKCNSGVCQPISKMECHDFIDKYLKKDPLFKSRILSEQNPSGQKVCGLWVFQGKTNIDCGGCPQCQKCATKSEGDYSGLCISDSNANSQNPNCKLNELSIGLDGKCSGGLCIATTTPNTDPSRNQKDCICSGVKGPVSKKQVGDKCTETKCTIIAAHACSTANFKVLTSGDSTTCCVMVKALEYSRCKLAIEKTGSKIGASEDNPDGLNWGKPATVKITIDPTLGCGGATTFMIDNVEVYDWRMDIQGNYDCLLNDVIPHEVQHMVTATTFRQPIPRWIDEGFSTNQESQAEKCKHFKALIVFFNQGRTIPFNNMFNMMEYPKDVLTIYAQGSAIVDYLIGLGGGGSIGERKFMEFVNKGLKNGWDSALKEEYGFNSKSDFQIAWVNYVSSFELGRTSDGQYSLDGCNPCTCKQG